MKKTRQGVRDLNHLPAKEIGRKLELPEGQQGDCNHPKEKRREVAQGMATECQCGARWDADGMIT